MRDFLKRLHADETGAMSVEKILILALIAVPLIVLLVAFRRTITEWFNTEAARLQNP
jgi:Flp pilus assembly pilin Flp